MRLTTVLVGFVSVAGCGASPTAPPVTPPSGLPVTLSIAPLVPFTRTTAHAMGAGDSVVATAELAITGCADYTAVAGAAGPTIVVTVVSTHRPRICSADFKAALFRTVVRPAPRGTYDVVLRERHEGVDNGPIEREVTRWPVRVP